MKKTLYPKIKKTHLRVYNGVRNTHNMALGIEDLTAVEVEIMFMARRLNTLLEGLNREIDGINQAIDKAMHITHILRRGPYAYPVDDDLVAIKTVRLSGNLREVAEISGTDR